MKSGIYCIKNLVNSKLYIGYTVNFTDRKNSHFELLRKKKHYNSKLQRAFLKYGEGNFQFEIIEKCEKEFLMEKEDYWCKFFNTHKDEFGYNISPTSPKENLYYKEKAKKISLALTGKKQSDVAKENARKRMIGNQYGKGKKREKNAINKGVIKQMKPVEIYDKNGIFIKEYKSAAEAARDLAINPFNVHQCARGVAKTIKGYQVKYKEDIRTVKKVQYLRNIGVNIRCIYLETGNVIIYKNIQEIITATGLDYKLINNSLRKSTKKVKKLYRFEYETTNE